MPHRLRVFCDVDAGRGGGPDRVPADRSAAPPAHRAVTGPSKVGRAEPRWQDVNAGHRGWTEFHFSILVALPQSPPSTVSGEGHQSCVRAPRPSLEQSAPPTAPLPAEGTMMRGTAAKNAGFAHFIASITPRMRAGRWLPVPPLGKVFCILRLSTPERGESLQGTDQPRGVSCQCSGPFVPERRGSAEWKGTFPLRSP